MLWRVSRPIRTRSKPLGFIFRYQSVLAVFALANTLMLRLIIIVAALTLGPVANAEPLIFACYGEMSVLGVTGTGRTPEKYSLPLTIDLQAGIVKVGNYGSASLMHKEPGDDEDTVFFIAGEGMTTGVSSGDFNRITGALSVYIFPPEGGLLGFDGICEPATKL